MNGRRRFLRWCALGTIVAGLGTLVGRRASERPEERCTNQGFCRGCGSYDGCRLPQALSMKEAVRR